MAARCKALGMSSLIVDRCNEVGDIWKTRYEYLSLHFPHWPDDLPYFSYPKHWPTYTPAQKQGRYMEWYASALELNIWTKSNVVKADQDDCGKWTVLFFEIWATTINVWLVATKYSWYGMRQRHDIGRRTL